MIHDFKETFEVDIMEGYGLTETTSAVAVIPAIKQDRDRWVFRSVGFR